MHSCRGYMHVTVLCVSLSPSLPLSAHVHYVCPCVGRGLYISAASRDRCALLRTRSCVNGFDRRSTIFSILHATLALPRRSSLSAYNDPLESRSSHVISKERFAWHQACWIKLSRKASKIKDRRDLCIVNCRDSSFVDSSNRRRLRQKDICYSQHPSIWYLAPNMAAQIVDSPPIARKNESLCGRAISAACPRGCLTLCNK